MALIIKGNVPNSCGFCWECNVCRDGVYYCNRVKRHISDVVPPYDKRMEWCPIIGEVPDKHGELKDVLILLHYLSHMHGATEHDNDLLREFEKMIRECPTVLEATE